MKIVRHLRVGWYKNVIKISPWTEESVFSKYYLPFLLDSYEYKNCTHVDFKYCLYRTGPSPGPWVTRDLDPDERYGKVSRIWTDFESQTYRTFRLFKLRQEWQSRKGIYTQTCVYFIDVLICSRILQSRAYIFDICLTIPILDDWSINRWSSSFTHYKAERSKIGCSFFHD